MQPNQTHKTLESTSEERISVRVRSLEVAGTHDLRDLSSLCSGAKLAQTLHSQLLVCFVDGHRRHCHHLPGRQPRGTMELQCFHIGACRLGSFRTMTMYECHRGSSPALRIRMHGRFHKPRYRLQGLSASLPFVSRRAFHWWLSAT